MIRASAAVQCRVSNADRCMIEEAVLSNLEIVFEGLLPFND